jgi:hypothetical protein
MKKLFTTIFVIFLFSFNSFSQELEENALRIKQDFNSGYENTIKKYALIKWKDEFSMVVYEINKQSDALTNLIEKFKSKNTTILYKAIIKWSQPLKTEANHKNWKELSSIDLASMLKFHTDWTMVEYEYDKESKAANAF